jgi:hypothetical protein
MTTDLDPAVAIRARNNAFALLPAPFIAVALLLLTVGAPLWVPLGLGAAGWMLALILRQPVALIANAVTTQKRAATIVGWFSGPAEELVRLALVLLFLRTATDALWAGFGWATIEVVVVAINALAISSLLKKDDAKSREARKLLSEQGMIVPESPGWGLLERLAAIAMHIGLTLILFANPWLVLVTLPLHSVTNMMMVRFAKMKLSLAELGFTAVSAAILLVGIVLNF